MGQILSFHAKVLEKKSLADDILFFSLTAPENFMFKAGQFVNLVFEKEGQKFSRSYSILNPPMLKERIHLCVKLIPGGPASEIMENTVAGDEFLVKGPFGHFTFDEQSRQEQWFIGTGTGITPFYSMLFEYVAKMPEKKFVLLFGVRRKENLFLHQEFMQLAKKNPNFSYIPTLSQEKWEGKSGRVQDHFPVNLIHKLFYICGLKEMVLGTKELLLEKGVEPENIKIERYT